MAAKARKPEPPFSDEIRMGFNGIFKILKRPKMYVDILKKDTPEIIKGFTCQFKAIRKGSNSFFFH